MNNLLPHSLRHPRSSNLPARVHSVLAALLVCLSFHSMALAEWTIISTKSIGSPCPGLDVVQTECKNGDATARLTALVFKDNTYTLRVVDSPSPGNAILENSLRHAGVPAGVNGGYFHPDFTPLGLVVSNATTLHNYEKAKLLSGVVGADSSGRISILRSTEYRSKKPDFRDAIQCGPMLLEKGSPVSGLNAERIARRTAAATGTSGLAALVYISSVSLKDAAQILALPKIFGAWAPSSALNLDGGTSSGMWADAIISLPEIKRVRNFLAVVPLD
mgnify:CR=1 FL=1|jgi:uncharacterized protein YigE (DUF2233 family)